jgi:catechol 2,3-dioxygenase-like lactoylglutathione lyase family enzyme
VGSPSALNANRQGDHGLAASLRFYVDVLGLEHVEQLSIRWGTMHRLRFGDSWLEIVDPDEVPPDGAPITRVDAAVPIRCLTFEIDDVEEARMAAVRAAPTLHPLGPFGSNGVVSAMVLDPDGNLR